MQKPVKKSIYDIARELGDIVAQAQRARADLAIAVAKEAQAHQINEDHANQLYAEYLVHSQGKQPDKASNSFRANASKLLRGDGCGLPGKAHGAIEP